MKTQNEQATQLIKRAENILCITQQKSTPDGVASALALQVLIDRLGKKSCAVVPNQDISKLSFLTGYELINTKIPNSNDIVIKINSENIEKTNVQKIDNYTQIVISPENGKINLNDISVGTKIADFDLILALDMPDLESLGEIFEEQVELFAEIPIISISADPAHDFFGRISISEPQKSSTSEIIFDLIEKDPELKTHLDKTISTILLTGIIATTNSFLSKNTTPSSLAAASILQEKGAIQSDIIENLFKKKSLSTLKVWGRILGNLQVDLSHRISWSNITKADFTRTESSSSDIDNITESLLRFIKDTDLATIVFEEGNQTFVQIRTALPSINLKELQKSFGGEIVKNGIDITIEDKTIAEIESNLLDALVHFQNERLDIDPPTKLKKSEITHTKEGETTHLDLHLKNNKTTNHPKAPMKIPFSAPLQPHENSTNRNSAKKEATKEPPKEKYNPKQSGIPDWLKQ